MCLCPSLSFDSLIKIDIPNRSRPERIIPPTGSVDGGGGARGAPSIVQTQRQVFYPDANSSGHNALEGERHIMSRGTEDASSGVGADDFCLN